MNFIYFMQNSCADEKTEECCYENENFLNLE